MQPSSLPLSICLLVFSISSICAMIDATALSYHPVNSYRSVMGHAASWNSMHIPASVPNLQNNVIHAGVPGTLTKVLTTVDVLSTIQSNAVVIVYFDSAWCGVCKHLLDDLKQIASVFSGQAIFLEVDIDMVFDAMETFGVSELPTTQAYVHGQPFQTVIGATEVGIIAMVEQAVVAA